MQMLEKLSVESREKFQQSVEGLETHYKTSEFEATTARNGIILLLKSYDQFVIDIRIKNLNIFLNERKDMVIIFGVLEFSNA